MASSKEYLEYENFNQDDAATLRKLVYNTDRIVCSDEAVMDILKTALNAFLSGEKTAEETAKLIQSRMNIYVSEHYG